MFLFDNINIYLSMINIIYINFSFFLKIALIQNYKDASCSLLLKLSNLIFYKNIAFRIY